MKKLSLAHTSWLQPFVAYFSERDISLEPYMDSVQIPHEVVLNGDGWVTKPQLYGFLNNIAEGESMPELGFVVGQRLTLETMDELGNAVMEADTLGRGIQVFSRLLPRHVENNRITVETGGGEEVWFLNEKLDWIDGMNEIADQAGLMSLINLVKTAAPHDWQPQRLRLRGAATTAYRKVSAIAECDIQFDCPATGLAFPSSFLLRPVNPSGDRANLKEGPGLLNQDESTEGRIRRILNSVIGLGGDLPSFQFVSEVAGISPRTLHRRLNEEGQVYQKILDEVRVERARELLTGTDDPLKEIAFELGYSGANNFIRAFKRFAGMTPSEYRKGTVESAP